MRLPRIVVAGTASGVGKTTIATGLMAALRAAGHRVAGFKVGPDFIDPSYHQAATGSPSRNLDAVLSGSELLGPLLAHGAADADIAVIEGVMGLFDGASRRPAEEPDPGARVPFASTAHVARLLDAPIVLVVDADATSASIAATVHGFATYEPSLRVAGVIVNHVASDRHEELVRSGIATVGLPVLGVLRRAASLVTPSRHLGLVPVAERAAEAAAAVADVGARVADSVDLRAVMMLARQAPGLAAERWTPHVTPVRDRPRIAVAGGRAFSFTYTENLELLTAAGADIVALDPLTDPRLPDGTAALYLGGGFPESHGEQLSANVGLRESVRDAARAGMPVLAECGGLLYLCRTLDDMPMCGVLDAAGAMTDGLTLGYREAQAASHHPVWRSGEVVRGHEFHHSAVTPGTGASPAWRLDGHEEGFVVGGVHASYLHTHWAATPHVAQRFVAAAVHHSSRSAVTP